MIRVVVTVQLSFIVIVTIFGESGLRLLAKLADDRDTHSYRKEQNSQSKIISKFGVDTLYVVKYFTQ